MTINVMLDEGAYMPEYAHFGTIRVKLYNHGDQTVTFERGDKITQLVVLPFLAGEFEQVDGLDDTERGAGGFGSTGR